MRLLAPVLILGLFAASTAGEPATVTGLRLIEDLGSDDPAVRRVAAREIGRREDELAPMLETVLGSANDPEVIVKLREILYGPLPWHDNAWEALEEAAANGKPIFMVEDAGSPEFPRDKFGTAFRVRTLADHRIRAELRREFVLLWVSRTPSGVAESAPAIAPAEAGECEAWLGPDLYFATSGGAVRHRIGGWLSADILLEELARVRKLIDAPTPEEAFELRAAMARELDAAGRRDGHDRTAEAHGMAAICRDRSCLLFRLSQWYASARDLGTI